MTWLKLSVHLAVAAVVLALVGCGSKKPDPAVGYWEMDVDETYELQFANNEPTDMEKLEDHKALTKKMMTRMNIIINEDHTADVIFRETDTSMKFGEKVMGVKGAKQQETQKGKWRKVKDGYELDLKAEDSHGTGTITFSFSVQDEKMDLSWTFRRWSLKRGKNKS